ncbi:MAG TPA: 2-oxo-4-hydroxy-4-carboxy-5-ureidoimidazoline decarboxylase [Gaiella sp.]|jgi:2-oxo-4-hydroxy-4-carboxy--5-ureidoimidazoline (OHCU) decarboxylase|nr:2-oxo-4-hydroxy-4-carboxy-5-ureidoimidazoline decarboxylase [Gaiella sp.]
MRNREREEGARGGTRGSSTQDLPRELSAEQLAELFEGRTRFVDRLAHEQDPLVRARTLVHEIPEDEKREILDAHPKIGQRKGLSTHSAAEQGSDVDPGVLAELHRLNATYEERHGFRFVVFVNRRPKAEILDVLRDRIDNPTDVELETALGELVAIATDRWARR